MNHRTRLVLVLPVVGAIAAIATAATISFGASPGDPGRQPLTSSAAAIARVRAVAKTTEPLRVTKSIDTPTSRGMVVAGARVNAIVDAATGDLGLLELDDNAPSSNRIAITASDAVSAATAFAESAGIAVPAAAPSVELADHTSTVEYVVSWVRSLGGIQVPDQLVEKVNAETGAVFSLVRVDRSFATPAAPLVSREEAIDIAGRAAGGSARRLDGADPVVVFDHDGKQRTAWRIRYRITDQAGAFYGSMVLVDATSGLVVDLP